LDDDIAAYQGRVDYDRQQYNAALAGGDPRAIAQWANALADDTDALEQLKGSVDQSNAIQQQLIDLQTQMVQNQSEILALANPGRAIFGAVIAAVSGGIGGRVGLGFQAAGTPGSVARY